MRLFVAAALALFSFASPAMAQRDDQFTGTWAFQTVNYSEDPSVTRSLSGAVIIRRSGRSYDIRMYAQELTAAPGGGFNLAGAHQRCQGEVDGGQLTIVCELTDNIEGYLPDNFVLQVVEPGIMHGVLVSAATGEAFFTRLR